VFKKKGLLQGPAITSASEGKGTETLQKKKEIRNIKMRRNSNQDLRKAMPGTGKNYQSQEMLSTRDLKEPIRARG